jgi:hypothetical protein
MNADKGRWNKSIICVHLCSSVANKTLLSFASESKLEKEYLRPPMNADKRRWKIALIGVHRRSSAAKEVLF